MLTLRFFKKIAREINIFCDYRKNRGNTGNIFLDDRKQDLLSDKRSAEITRMLISVYHQQKALEDQILAPYRARGAWAEEIDIRRADYLNALNENNIQKLDDLLRSFFRNSGVAGIWSIAYFEKAARGSVLVKMRFISEVLRNYLIWKNVVGADLKELEIPSTGNPWGYLLEGVLIQPNSFGHHYCANRMKHLFTDYKRPVICEIGGGYGGFAYYLSKTLDSCVYINFDLPEVLLVCSYYLKMSLPQKKILLFDQAMFGRPLPDLNDYDIVLMPHYMLPFMRERSVDIVVNAHSLSEMDYQTVEEYIGQIDRIAKKYFFHINSDKAEVNTGGHIEIRSSSFPIDKNKWKNIYTVADLFTESARYKEYLYERR